MKKSLNAWTVDGSLGMEAMFEAVSRAGFDGIESPKNTACRW